MRKVIAAINMTLDGYCDHTAVVADAELHDHYSELIRSADTALYGRITYQLMEFWKDLLDNPSGDKSMDDFARMMDGIPKVVFSRTLHEVDWPSARLAEQDFEQEVKTLRAREGGDILVCSRSLIVASINLGLADEFQITVHPVIAGQGLPLLDLITDRRTLKLTRTRNFASGAITLYYNLR